MNNVKSSGEKSNDLKNQFHITLTYIETVFDIRTLKEWLKWNRLHLTWGSKAIMKESEFDAWVEEWKGKKNESISGKK